MTIGSRRNRRTSEGAISRRRLLQGAGLAGAAGALALTPTVALADSDNHDDRIVGTWRGAATGPVLPGFGLLTTYGRGGTALASASIDLEPQFLSTPSYGAWKRTGEGGFAVKFEFFTFAANGTPSGSGEVTGTVTVEGDSLQGTLTLTIFDLAGHTIFTTTDSTTATRVKAG